MGWCGGGDVFEPVARELIAAGVSDDVRYRVCKALIKALQAGDWDTEDESLGEFRSDPVIVKAFAECGIKWCDTCDYCSSGGCDCEDSDDE